MNTKIEPKRKIDVQLSNDYLNKKSDLHLVENIWHFSIQHLNYQEILDKITNGYIISACYKNEIKRMREAYTNGEGVEFDFTYIVIFDLDWCQQSFKKFIDSQKLKPTFAHTSCNHGKNGITKAHLFYVLNKRVKTPEEYKRIWDYFYRNLTLGTAVIDKHSRDTDFYLSSVKSQSTETYISNITYSIKNK